MSVSKLESLPNEILVEILEKYINGIDVLIAFAYQQNQRFNALIAQCQRLQFNFINCRKDDFRFCLGLLPAYIENIGKLSLSEQNTPGQIYAFFSFFQSFASFGRLRKLYLHFDAKAIEWEVVQTAILSLSRTTIDTLSIKAIDTDTIIPTLDYVIADMFRLPTLKRFSINSDFQRIQWDFLTNISSNIEYLTIAGICCEFQHLKSIFQCASRLKYLDVRLTCASRRSNYALINRRKALINRRKTDVIPMPTLDTLILSFTQTDPTTFDMLAQYLKVMPALRRLQIIAHNTLLDASAWETLLQTSLPLLTYFTLQTTLSGMEKAALGNILSSFESPFWIAKENFYMLITKHQKLDLNIYNMQAADQYEYDLPITQWWTVPIRTRLGDMPVSKITSLGISGVDISLCLYNCFNNINHLVINNLDEDLLEWIKTYVNYSRIRYLDISRLTDESNTITSLLSCATNISSLQIQYNHLLAHQDVYLERKYELKYLDISVVRHMFDQKDIITISRLFPDIEHLSINATSLSNVPLLQTYLPQLRSLTFKIIDYQFSLYDDYEQKVWDDQLRQNVHFLFQRRSDFITVWIDQDALKEPYWEEFALDWS